MPLILGTLASAAKNFLWAPEGAYDSLATVTLSATTASVTFAGIPSGYKHLQIRVLSRSSAAVNADNINLTYNGSTSSYYAYHQLYGTGSAAFSNTSNDTAKNQTGYYPGANIASSIFGVTIMDILDYSNTSKNKVVRTLTGYDSNGDGLILLRSGLWMETSAISSITLTGSAGSFVTNSQFALYGVK
jgi:hypothetical protein